jgi:ADP-heptose:LPS heptosyltransferase
MMIPTKILVVPLRYIGDTILTVPLIRELHRQFPAAQIDVLSSKTAAPLLEPCPYIHQLIIEPNGLAKNLELLKQGKYDAIFILRKSFTLALLAKLAEIPIRIGYDKQRFPKPINYKRWGLFLTRAFPYPRLRTETHQVDSHMKLLQALPSASASSGDGLELWSTQKDVQALERILSQEGINSNQPIAVLHAASASHGKAIELSKFAESLKLLSKQGFQILATGTQSDVGAYQHLKTKYALPLAIMAGKTTLRETFALYQRTQLLLSVDSSPIHIGAAANIPKIVGIFGPTNHRQWGPYFGPKAEKQTEKRFFPVYIDLECRPCYAKVCSHNNCKELLTAGQIALAVKEAINS